MFLLLGFISVGFLLLVAMVFALPVLGCLCVACSVVGGCGVGLNVISGLLYRCFVLAVVAWVSEVLCVGHGFVLVSFLVCLISVCFLLLAAVVLALLVLAVAVLSVFVFSVVVLALVFASLCSLCWQLWCWLWCWLWYILCVGGGSVCFCVCGVVCLWLVFLVVGFISVGFLLLVAMVLALHVLAVSVLAVLLLGGCGVGFNVSSGCFCCWC